MKLYLAHPISGRTPDEVMPYFEDTAAELRDAVPGLVVMSPLVGKGHLRTERKFKAHGYDHPLSKNRAIRGRDRWMVAQADVVYANLTLASDASIGACFEMAWACDQRHTYLVVAMGLDNPHMHGFVLDAADAVWPTHEEAMVYLTTALREMV